MHTDNRIDLGTPDALWIGGSVFAKTPDALQAVLARCREAGYQQIEDRRDDPEDSMFRNGRSNEELEASGWHLWRIRLGDIRHGKCDSCGSYITTVGILFHGNRCEVCGAVTYEKIINGSTVEFTFLDPADHSVFSPGLKMPAVRWDSEQGDLYLRLRFIGGWRRLTEEKAWAYLQRHHDKWELVRVGKHWCIKIHYANDIFVRDDDTIEVREIWGHRYNHKIVKVWDGEEYPEHARLPIREEFDIHESWRWDPFEPSPTLHETILRIGNVVEDQGYYHQDGRPAVDPKQFETMGLFIRHFTTLDADRWDAESPHFPLDGPGAIAAVARFCHEAPAIRNEPNIGNTIEALANGLSGHPVSQAELAAAADGVKDPRFAGFLR